MAPHSLRDILSRVLQEGKFYLYNCDRWMAYGWRLGQLQYETRMYRDGRVRSQLFTRRGCLADFGRGEYMDGIITLDSTFAKEIGFTSDKFDGYLWRKNQTIIISFITSLQEGKGNLRNLFSKILSKGFSIQVPAPFAQMEWICKRMGFKKKIIPDELFGVIEIMEGGGDGRNEAGKDLLDMQEVAGLS